MNKTAVVSVCGTYRYRLGRRWGIGESVLWIMLNPSTADAYEDDPTIRRCMGFSRDWGFHAIEVVNLCALRATNPQELWQHPNPVGPNNGVVLKSEVAFGTHSLIMAAWGAHLTAAKPARTLLNMAADHEVELHCLGLTKYGYPRHPLYVKGDVKPQRLRDTR